MQSPTPIRCIIVMPEAELKASPPAKHQLGGNKFEGGIENTAYHPSASEPLPIKYPSSFRNQRMTDGSEVDIDDDSDQRVYTRISPPQFTLSTFSEWGTESVTTDEDPFIYDDDTSWAKPSGKLVSTMDVKKKGSAAANPSMPFFPLEATRVINTACVDENLVGCGGVVVVGSKQMLVKWLGFVWGVFMRIFQRRGKEE